MAKYSVALGGRRYRVEIQDSQVTIDGEPLGELELVSLNGNGLHMVRQDRRHIEVYLKSVPPDGFEVIVNGRPLPARVGLAGQRLRERTHDRVGALTAPMPGAIVKVLVEPGQRVCQGEVLLVQESMKMQMQLRAPADALVTSVSVRMGDQVKKGDVLVELSPDRADEA